MKYSELVDSGATSSQVMDYLSEGEPTPITLRVPRNLKDAAAEAARLRGVSFSAFIRSCIINELSEGV
jgi:predicted HicB family RNase H-like nuclease